VSFLQRDFPAFSAHLQDHLRNEENTVTVVMRKYLSLGRQVDLCRKSFESTSSEDWHTTASHVDLRVGGHFSSRMEAKDGSFGFDFAGTYTNIVLYERIEYAFGERTATVEFKPTPLGVAVSVSFVAETENPIEQQQAGWQAILTRFKSHVESKIHRP
jgi:hypothetical protein